MCCVLLEYVFICWFQILQSCISCLGAVVNGVTHNYKLVKDCFQKFFGKFTLFAKLIFHHK